jgi:hypothetical protein
VTDAKNDDPRAIEAITQHIGLHDRDLTPPGAGIASALGKVDKTVGNGRKTFSRALRGAGLKAAI